MKMTKHVKKKRKHLGNRNHGGGNAKNRRGKGNKGGIGNAGKLKHKWFHTIKFELEAMRKKRKGFYRRKPIVKIVKLSELAASDKTEFDLEKSKVIGSFDLKKPITVKAFGFSKGAKNSIESAGGKAVVV